MDGSLLGQEAGPIMEDLDPWGWRAVTPNPSAEGPELVLPLQRPPRCTRWSGNPGAYLNLTEKHPVRQDWAVKSAHSQDRSCG
jgi:hypothetical protein